MKYLHRILAPLLLSALLPLLAASGLAQQDSAPPRTAPWSERTLELAESLPVQDAGRVKPLSTYAKFTLMRFSGRSSLKTPTDEKLSATAWLLDVLFHPKQAADYLVFNVDDVQAIEAFMPAIEGKKKRDRYSFNELKDHVRDLFGKAREYGAKEERDRTLVESQVFALATSVDDYIRLQTHFDYARFAQHVDTPALEQAFGGHEVDFSQIVAKVPDLMSLQGVWRTDSTKDAESNALMRVLQTASEFTSGTESLALIPPTGTMDAEPAWHSPADLFTLSFQDNRLDPQYIESLAAMESLARAAGDAPGFEKALSVLHGKSVKAATRRGEYEKVGLEVDYYKRDFIGNSQVVFILAFVLAACLWLVPRSKALYMGAGGAVFIASVLLVAAIVMRCIIRERPPVSTLYETLLFVTATGALTLLVVEWINRQRIALSVAAVLGVLGLFLANRYEALDKRDTMPQLVAVLDTNFWLATHVTAITIGYSAGMVAAAIANVYLITRLFGIRKREPAFAKNLTRMTYGVLAFGLIFSVVGTILGGIWANESWGRFWGWDPKENGALMICLSQIVFLHGRMGGYLRDFGINMAAALGGTVIAFSWFGVNLLGVGLHSYGFTSGIHTALWSYYGGQWGLLAVCLVHYLVQKSREEAVQQALAARGGGPAASTAQGRME